MRKEQFKTVLLVILFLLSITLTQQLWISIPLAEVLPTSKQTESQDAQNIENIKIITSIVSPQSFIVNFGGGLHTVLYTDYYNMGQDNFEGFWPETLALLKTAYFANGATVEEIAKEKWEEAYNSRSVLMDFGYSMPLYVLRHLSGGEEAGISGKIAEIDSVLVSASEGTGIYMANKGTGKFYYLKGRTGDKGNFSLAISQIEENDYNIYIDALKDSFGDKIAVGEGFESDRLIPVSFKENIPKIQVVQEIDTYNENQVEDFSSTFFGESFDFVRKITETNGAVIYMYGYGKRVLKIDESGLLEYVEEIDPQKSSSNVDYWEGIKEAVRFVSQHGDGSIRIHI